MTNVRTLLLLFALMCVSGCEERAAQQDIPSAHDEGHHEAFLISMEDPAQWVSHGRTYSEQRFSPLTQINTESISDLGLAWSFDLPTRRGIEATPIVVDGVMYVSAAWNLIYAFDAKTGAKLWSYDPEVSRPWVAKYACCDAVSRGVAVWQGKVYAATLDGRLLALDGASGALLWEVLTIDPSKPYTITGAPRVVKGNVLIGNSGADYGVRGYLSAYDAETGERVWRFYTVPGNPDDGFENDAMRMAAETWTGDWWRYGGGGTVWNSMAYDPDLDLLYFGVGNGTPWSRDLRSPGGGDNLFLSSIVAVRPDTGEYVWHYQTTPGESWNYSAVESIILADLIIDGRMRKAVIQAPKNGFFYVLDRETGAFISAQPYIALNWASHVDPKTGRPVKYPFAHYGTEGRLIVPGPSGGHSWYPMSYNPQTGLAYIPVQDVPNSYQQVSPFEFKPGYQNTGIAEGVTNFRARNPQDQKQPLKFGVYLIAWDPAENKERWRVPHQSLGGGTLTTAGNLVFQGLGSGAFVAFDAQTGDKVWSYMTGTPIMPGAVSYEVDGEQYITVMVGRGGGSGLVGGPMGMAWQQVENLNRVLTFKLGGQSKLSPPLKIARVLDPPQQGATEEQISEGKVLYDTYCYMCHGLDVMSGGVIPDLKYSDQTVHEQWIDIVIDGALEENGMRSFGDILSKEDALAIQGYVLAKAHALKKRHIAP